MSDPESTEDAPKKEEEEEEVPVDQVMLKGLVILPPRQATPNDAEAIQNAVALPLLRAEEPVQSLRGALAEVVGYSHLTNFRFEVRAKPAGKPQGMGPTLVSPFTGKNAVVSVPLAVKSLEADSYGESAETALDAGALDEYGNLTKLVEEGWHEKDAAFEIVLERYDLAAVKDHVARLRSLLSGNAPAIVSLIDEEDTHQTDDEASKDSKEAPSEKEQQEASKKEEEEKASKPMPPLPAYSPPPSDSKTVDGTLNLKDFFYRVSGEDPAMYCPDGASERSNSNAGKANSKKKKKSKSGKVAKVTADEDTKESEEAPEASEQHLRKLLPQWNKLEEEAKLPFVIQFSGFHPPPPPRRLLGDLAYLELVPLSPKEKGANGSSKPVVQVTAVPTGFYVNNNRASGSDIHFDPSPASDSCFSHSLLDCLLQASDSFRDAWSKVVSASKSRATLMKSLNKDAALSFFRVAVRGDFAGFSSASSAAQSIQQALDGSLSTPSWLVPRPKDYPGADADNAWNGFQFHPYNPNRAEEEISSSFGVDLRNGGIRDWNEELQLAREMPTESLPERIERARLLHKVMTEFGEASLLGVKAICDGHIAPMNPNEGARSQVFLHNNIFFSRAVDAGPETFKIAQGDRAARKAANRDIQCIATLHRSEKSGLYTLATVLIDYLGTRFVCQSILPGILIGEKSHKLLYGAVESGVPLQWDKNLHNQLKESVAEPMMVASRPVFRHPLTEERMEEVKRLKLAGPFYPELVNKEPEEEVESNATIETCIPIEAKGILGSDQRQYLLDFGRLTPRDANWIPEDQGGSGKFEAFAKELAATSSKTKSSIPASLEDDEWTVSVLRPELINRFTQSSMSKYMNAKKAAKAEKEAAEKKEEGESNDDVASKEKSSGEIAEKDSNEEAKEEETKKLEEEDKKSGALDKEDLEHLETLKLNLNVFLPNMKSFDGFDEEAAKQMKLDEDKVREAACFLWDDILPKITRAIKDGSVQPIPLEGKGLTEFLHRNGVNCRYLGRLAFLAKAEEQKDRDTDAGLKQGKLTVVERRTMPKCWLELLECEMVARAAKHVLDSYLTEHGGVAAAQPSQTVASFLSALVSERDETAAQTETRLEKRSASEPDDDDMGALTIRDTGGHGDLSSTGIRGRYEVWQDIEAEVGRRFRCTLSLYNSGNKSGRALYIPLLRRICQRTGIRIIAKDYDVGGRCLCSGGNTFSGHLTDSYPISPLDIADIVPLMKHAASYNEGFTPCAVGPTAALPALQVSLRDARVALERAHIQTSQRALGRGLELAQEAASLYQRVTDNPAHPGIIESIELMASIFLEAGDPDMAAANGSKALTLSIQSNGFDNSRVFSSHMTLFQMYLGARETEQAIKHLHAAIYVLEIMAGPRHSEGFNAYHKLGSVYSHDDQGGKYLLTALKFLEEAVQRDSCDRLLNGITSKSLAKVLAGVGQFKDAVEAEKKAFQVLSMFLGKEHQLTKESDSDLKAYMANAVEQGTRMVASEKILEEEKKAEAVAAALEAEEDQQKKKKSNKKKKGKK